MDAVSWFFIKAILIIALIGAIAGGVFWLINCTGGQECHGAWYDWKHQPTQPAPSGVDNSTSTDSTLQPWQEDAAAGRCDGPQGWNNTTTMCTHDQQDGWHFHYFRGGIWTH